MQYFDLLSQTLEFIPNKDTFGGKENFIVDERANAVESGKRVGSASGGVSWSSFNDRPLVLMEVIDGQRQGKGYFQVD